MAYLIFPGNLVCPNLSSVSRTACLCLPPPPTSLSFLFPLSAVFSSFGTCVAHRMRCGALVLIGRSCLISPKLIGLGTVERHDHDWVKSSQWGSHGGMYMPDYYWDQNNAVPVDYLCSQWFLRPEWLQYMWVSSDREGDAVSLFFSGWGCKHKGNRDSCDD